MNRLSGLVVFSRVIVRLLNWLDDNFNRIFEAMREQCPDENELMLANRITDTAFSAAF